MNIHIQCLSLMIILFTINPLSIAKLIEFIKGSATEVNINRFLRNLSCIYTVAILVISYVMPKSLIIAEAKDMMWIAIAIISAPLVILIEILVSYIALKIRNSEVTKIEISSIWVSCSDKMLAYTVAIGILEEVVYRQIWFYLLLNMLDCNVLITILLSSVFYSLNHITLGKDVVVQKFISGIIFSVLFYISGEAIIIPIICHGLQNLIVVIGGRIIGNKA